MTQSTALIRLTEALPLIYSAFQEAKHDGIPTLVIAARAEDGSGKIIMTLDEPEHFLKDIAEALQIPFEMSEEQIAMYRAQALLSKFSLNKE
jgi:hypothetical protein